MRIRFTLTLLTFITLLFPACKTGDGGETNDFFIEAVPVWAEGRDTEMNMTMLFRAEFDDPGVETRLRLAASTIYRVRVNDRFLASGPARGPRGFFRVDDLDLTGLLSEEGNVLTIEVAGYNCNSYYLIDQPSFLQAEVRCGERVVAATGPEGSSFPGFILGNRIQKVQRFSFQRPFTEAYRYDRPELSLIPAGLAESPGKRLLPRGVHYPTYTVLEPVATMAPGRFAKILAIHPVNRDRSLTDIGPQLKGFPEQDLELCPMVELQNYESVPGAGEITPGPRTRCSNLESWNGGWSTSAAT